MRGRLGSTCKVVGLGIVAAVYRGDGGLAADWCARRLVFVGNADGYWDLFIASDSHEGVVGMSRTTDDKNGPSWSNSGGRIAYSSGDGALRIIEVQTKKEQKLCVGGKGVRNSSASFSPDDRKIVYVRFRPEARDDSELAIFDLEKSTHTPFLDQYGSQLFPDWSPDGKQIVYTSAHCGMECGRIIQELWVADVNGKSARQLLMTNSHCTHPVWSPDGKKIAFSSDKTGGFDIWILTLEGGRLEQLTNDAALDTSPAWSPNGQRLAFISDRTGKLRIWIRDLRTGEETMFFLFHDEAVECRDVTW